MIKLCDIDLSATAKLPPAFADKSGIGVHYVDAVIKPMNTALPDGTRVSCKRRGLKVIFKVGPKNGEGLMRRLQFGPDPVAMLKVCLAEAALAACVQLQVTEKEILIAP
jgi:hypothetical protein